MSYRPSCTVSILDGSVIVVSLISFMTKGTLSQLPLVSDLQTLEANQ